MRRVVLGQQVICMAKPTDRGVIARISFGKNLLAIGAAGMIIAPASRASLSCVRHVFQVTEIQEVEHSAGIEIQQQAPQRLFSALRPEIKTGVGNRSQRQVDNPFVRTQPAKLRIVRQLAKHAPKISHQLLDFLALNTPGVLADGFANQVISPAHRQHQARARESFIRMKTSNGK